MNAADKYFDSTINLQLQVDYDYSSTVETVSPHIITLNTAQVAAEAIPNG